MRDIQPDPWDDADRGPTRQMREFAIQITKAPSGNPMMRLLVRTPGGLAVIDHKGTGGRSLNVGDIHDLVSTLQDAIAREATILGGVQLTL